MEKFKCIREYLLQEGVGKEIPFTFHKTANDPLDETQSPIIQRHSGGYTIRPR